MSNILIKNTRIFYNNRLQPAEVLIDNGKISKIAKDIRISHVDREIDADNALTLPAGIDAHVHFREPGQTRKEDWCTGSCSAAAGGITTVIDHPNTAPPTIDEKSFNKKLHLASKKSIVDFGINGGVTNNFDELSRLWELGATAFGEIFMAESTGELNISEESFNQALSEIKELEAVACIHAEDENIRLKNKSLLKNDMSPQSHSRARPNICESTAVQKAVDMISSFDTQSHFCHISTSEALGIIRNQKYKAYKENRKSNITCESAPHHLFLSDKSWDNLGSFGKMNPPLRTRKSVQALVNAINEGTVDMVASDHAPHREFEKDMDIKNAPSGVPGVETLLPLMLAGVKKNLFPLGKVIDVTSKNPAKRFGLENNYKGLFKEGFDADLILVNPQDMREISSDFLHSKAGWTPYSGLYGIFPQLTISRGDIIWDGEVTATRGRGNFLKGQGYLMDTE
ncbi:dihydroorotase [Methanohalobium sp.]|uniref:dihydroorotase n=1 Tax=Methanohalobium sp. TaxID=2837493 RepID=UPI0025EC935E|nr:dihydroorotase [Methanohalobium sp.]